MKRKNEHGFTLIELLIAVFILTIVLLAISSMVYSVMRSTAQSKETSTATALMQDKMESLKNTSLTSLNSGSDSVPMGGINFLRQWSVATTGNIRTITIKVDWTDRGPHTVTMKTLRAD